MSTTLKPDAAMPAFCNAAATVSGKLSCDHAGSDNRKESRKGNGRAEIFSMERTVESG